MCKVKNVYPEDVIVEFEFRLSDLKKLKIALDNCTINVSTEIPGSMEGSHYVTERLYPVVKGLIEEFAP